MQSDRDPRDRDTPSDDRVVPVSDDLMPLTVVTASPERTQRLGAALGRALRSGDLILLRGNLGAGKTTFTQGIGQGMGLTASVTSPSFTLANVYEPTGAGLPLYHLDLWRIKSALEALGIGLDEYLAAEGPCVIEWPEVAAEVLPADYLDVAIEREGEGRRLTFRPLGKRSAELVEDVRLSFPEAFRSSASGDVDAAGD